MQAIAAKEEKVPKKILLDFDGTVVEHRYPRMGRFVPHAIRVLNRLQNAGHSIILNTYRADCNDGTLLQAVSYLTSNEFVQRKLAKPVTPDMVLSKKMLPVSWNDLKADDEMIFIDDSAKGTPLIPAIELKGMPMVDWVGVEKRLEEIGVLAKQNMC